MILNESDIRPIDQGRGYLQHRMAQTIARSIQSELAQRDSLPRPEMVRAMKRMVGDIERGSVIWSSNFEKNALMIPQYQRSVQCVSRNLRPPVNERAVDIGTVL